MKLKSAMSAIDNGHSTVPETTGAIWSPGVDVHGAEGRGVAYELKFDASRVWGASHTANEFRPINVAVNYCMKHD
jgi:hypothetical protein